VFRDRTGERTVGAQSDPAFVSAGNFQDLEVPVNFFVAQRGRDHRAYMTPLCQPLSSRRFAGKGRTRTSGLCCSAVCAAVPDGICWLASPHDEDLRRTYLDWRNFVSEPDWIHVAPEGPVAVKNLRVCGEGRLLRL